MAVDKPGGALGMKGNKIQRRALRAGRIILSPQTVLEKITHELPATAGGVRTTNPRRRQRPPHAGNRKVMKFAEFLRRAPPITDVRFVPNLPVPLLDFSPAISFDTVL